MNWTTESSLLQEPISETSAADRADMTPADYLEQDVVVNVEHGMHMIPCSRIALIARETSCEVRVVLVDQIADARNVLDLLMLKAEQGTTLKLQACGEGAEQVLQDLVALFERNFELPSN